MIKAKIIDQNAPIKVMVGQVVGNGIKTIELVSTEGLVNTYRITYTNGNTFEFAIKNGEKGAKGDAYEITEEDYEAIADITTSRVLPVLDTKMSYYMVTVHNGVIYHDDTALTFADLIDLYNDPSVFLYMEYVGLTMIPNAHIDTLLTFSTAYFNREDSHIYQVDIDSDNVVTTHFNQIESDLNKISVINPRNKNSEKYYTSVKAVTSYVDNAINDLSIPTKTSELVNDSGFVTNEVTDALQSEVDKNANDLDVLWKLSEGTVYDYVTQTESGATNPPKGAFSYSVDEIIGESTQDTTNGYQLFPYINAPKKVTVGITAEMVDGVITAKGTASNNGIVYLLGTFGSTTPLFTLSAGTYTIGGGIQIETSGRTKTYARGTFTLNEDTDICAVAVFGRDDSLVFESGVTYDRILYPMLEKGSVAHPYEPYTGGIPMPNPSYPSEIHDVTEVNFKRTGKNLINLSGAIKSKINGVEFTPVGNGGIKAVGTATSTTYYGLWGRNELGDFGLLDGLKNGDTITQTDCILQQTNASAILGRTDSATKTIEPETTTIYVAVKINKGETVDRIYYPMIEKSSIPTPYAPYREETHTLPITLRSVGNVHDSIVVDDDVRVERRIGTESFTKNEPWKKEVLNNHSNFYTARKSVPSNLRTNCLSNYGIFNNRITEVGDMITSSGSLNIIAFAESTKTVDDLKTLLGDNNIIVNYIAEPTTETITDTYIQSLFNIPSTDNLFVYDQDGNDISFMVEYLRKLSDAR